MSEKEIRPSKTGYLVRLTAEQVAEMYPPFQWRNPVAVAEREAREKEYRAERDAEMTRLLEQAPSILHPIIKHHAPSVYGSCQGCDGGPDYGGEFPCSTIELIQELLEDNTPVEHSEP